MPVIDRVIILAGGEGRRFRRSRPGAVKLTARIRGVPVVRRVARAAQTVSSEVIVVTARSRRRRIQPLVPIGVGVAVDGPGRTRHPARGVPPGIRGLSSGRVLLLAGDLGHLTGRALQGFLVAAKEAESATLERGVGAVDPLCAVYSVRRIRRLFRTLRGLAGIRRMTDLLRSAPVLRVIRRGSARAFARVTVPADLRPRLPGPVRRTKARDVRLSADAFLRARALERRRDWTGAVGLYAREAADLRRAHLFLMAAHARADAAVCQARATPVAGRIRAS